MKHLTTQEEFEELLKPAEPSFVAIYFGATWCGPCRRIDTAALDAMPGVQWFKVDVDENNYTSGFCSVNAIPAFMVLKNGQPMGPIQESNMNNIMAWVSDQRDEWQKCMSSK